MGPDTILCRLNESKVLAWLQAKTERVRSCLQRLHAAAPEQAGMVKGFLGQGEEDSSAAAQAAAELSQQQLEASLSIVCEYLPAEWAAKLAASYAAVDASSMFEARGAKRKAATAVWEETQEEDRNLALSRGNSNRNSVESGSGSSRSQPTKPTSVAAKKTANKLAKVNTKGMKSIASLFGAAKKK